MNIQWYPGHMAKTRRMLEEQLRHVDMVLEILDARIPVSSRNPILDEIRGAKPRILILNRAAQADKAETKRWVRNFCALGESALATDCKSGMGILRIPAEIRTRMQEKMESYSRKGQAGRAVRAMVVGVPNVGKSTLINRMAGRNSARAENRPGVTRGRQWITVTKGLELLDTPGMLWPKFEDPQTGLHLAFTGAVKDEITDIETLALHLADFLAEHYPDRLSARYGIPLDAEMRGERVLFLAAKKRGFLMPGGEGDSLRMAKTFLDDFRSGKLGCVTLERAGGENTCEGTRQEETFGL